ncbi:MAG: hypothetical protein ACRDJW_00055 [Thermomicrobiales bacterium]
MTVERTSPTDTPKSGDQFESDWAESPKEFFERITKRPDIREILTWLARSGWESNDSTSKSDGNVPISDDDK